MITECRLLNLKEDLDSSRFFLISINLLAHIHKNLNHEPVIDYLLPTFEKLARLEDRLAKIDKAFDSVERVFSVVKRASIVDMFW